MKQARTGLDPTTGISDRVVFHREASEDAAPTVDTHRTYPASSAALTVWYGNLGKSVWGSGESANPVLDAERLRHRKRIAADQECYVAPVRAGSYFTIEERNQVIYDHQNMIRRIVSLVMWRGVSCHIERYDLIQRLNFALIKILDNYKPKPGVTLDAYLWRVLSEEVKQARRAESRGGPALEFADDVLRGKPEDAEKRQAQKADLWSAINQLGRTERRILMMSVVTGMTQAEIAAREGCSQARISKILAHCLSTVQKILQS
jgi:RNA polymerase sigma factor (sigma-70 family)